MDLPVSPPIKPMLAKAIPEMPERDDLIFEPKWDGFRCIIFKSGSGIVLGSRNEKSLTRYFPELLDPIKKMLPKNCVVDGELIVVSENKLAFSTLQQRIHPAESRINKLAEETPASFVGFDLLAISKSDLREKPFKTRREKLVRAFTKCEAPLFLTPITTNKKIAQEWFINFEGAGLDGLIAKPQDDPYAENKRSQLKLKHVRSADAVVAGYRMHKDGKGIGSLLLGLYTDGELRHVGVAASFTAKRRSELIEELKPLEKNALSTHPWKDWAEAQTNTGQMPGAQHRWSGKKDHSWIPLRIEKVVEVKYGSTLGGRFREVTKVLRWRPDKEPHECTLEQLEQPEPIGADIVLNAGEA